METVSFSSLQKYSTDRLEELELKKILDVCFVHEEEENRLDVYLFIIDKVTKVVDIPRLQSELLAVVLPNLREFYEINVQLADDGGRSGAAAFEVLSAIVLSVTGLLKRVEKQLQNFQLKDVECLVSFTLEILSLSYFLYKKKVSNHVHEIIQSFFAHCQDMQTQLIILIVDDVSGASEPEMKFIGNLLEGLSKVGEIIAQIDIKSMAEIWKCFSKISSDHAEPLKQYNIMNWLQRPIEFFSEELEKSMQDVTERPNSVEVTMKLNSFFVKLLVKLSQMYSHDQFHGHKSMIKTALSLRNAAKDADERIQDELETHLIVGIMNAVGQIFKSQEFAEHLFPTVRDFKDRETCLLFILDVIKMIIEESEEEHGKNFLNKDLEKNIFSVTFDLAEDSHSIFYENETVYKDIVAHLSALAILNANDRHALSILKEILARTVLGNAFWSCHLAVDIWSLLGRYVDPETCYNYFKFSLRVNETFPILTDEIRASFVKILLKNFYDYLPLTIKTDILLKDPPTVNKKLWIALGLNRIEGSTGRAFLQQVITITLEAAENVFKQKSVDSYYTLIDCMLLLSTASNLKNEKIQKMTVDVWKLCAKLNANDCEKFSKMIASLIELTTPTLVHMDNGQIAYCLSTLSSVMNLKPPVLLKLKAIPLLKVAAEKHYGLDHFDYIVAAISTMFYQLLTEKNKLVKLKCLDVFSDAAHHVKHEQIILKSLKSDSALKAEVSAFLKCHSVRSLCRKEIDEYMSRQSFEEKEHTHSATKINCGVGELVYEKKLKDDTTDDVLDRVAEDVATLVKLKQDDKLSGQQNERLHAIFEQLNSIAGNLI